METIEMINGKEYLAIDHPDSYFKCRNCCIIMQGEQACFNVKCNAFEREDKRNVYFTEAPKGGDKEGERLRRMREGLERAEKIMKAKKDNPVEPVRTKDDMIEVTVMERISFCRYCKRVC